MLPTELLKRIRHIEIYTDRLATDVFAGAYHSVFKGQGMEFAEVREYQIGDDVRTIDWRVSARAGRPYVRRYVEERELTVMLLVDASGSMNFGTQSATKAETMAETAATLAFSAIRNNDKVGLLIFTDSVECYLPPRKGRRQVLRVIREILYARPERRATNLSQALEYMNHILHRRAIVFIISDFLTSGYSQSLQIAARRHDVICVRIADAREAILPPVGLVEVLDAETGERRLLDISPATALALQKQNEMWTDQLKHALGRLQADLIEIQAGQTPADPLREFFARRAQRR